MNDYIDGEFNTGREYTKDGQIIKWKFIPKRKIILFADVSRGVSGEVKTVLKFLDNYYKEQIEYINEKEFIEYIIQRELLHMYDHGKFETTKEAHEYFMSVNREM